MKLKNKIITLVLLMLTVVFGLSATVSAATVKPKNYYSFTSSELSVPMKWKVKVSGNTINVDLYDKNAADNDMTCIWVVQDYSYVCWSEYNNKKSSLSIDTSGLSTGTYQLYMSRYGFYQYGGFDFKIKDGKVFLYSKGGGSEVTFRKKLKSGYKSSSYKKIPAYFKNKSGVNAITKKAKSICKNAKTKEKKIKAIHDWVAKNIAYDYEQYLNNNYAKAADPIWVFKHKRGVCSGYARLTKIMYSAVGIPCVNVIGVVDGYGSAFSAGKKVSRSKLNHEWNYVYYKGSWHVIDTTWDSKNRYYGKKADKSKGYVNAKGQAPGYQYYGAEPEVFGTNHYSYEVYEYMSK